MHCKWKYNSLAILAEAFCSAGLTKRRVVTGGFFFKLLNLKSWTSHFMHKTHSCYSAFRNTFNGPVLNGNYILGHLHTCRHTAYRRECAGKTDCQYVGRLLLTLWWWRGGSYSTNWIYQWNRSKTSWQRNHKFFALAKISGHLCSTRIRLHVSNYPFCGRGQTTNMRRQYYRALSLIDTVRDFKIIPPG